MSDQLAVEQIVNDRYQILSVIGEGGMGLVYRVRQIYLNKEFAFKVIKKTAFSEVVFRRFQQEARAAFALKHKNIIGVNDFGILEDSTPYLVMELVFGETLGQRLKRSGRLSIEEAIPLFLQICDGLDFAHKNKVIHRDVKPTNLMLIANDRDEQTPQVKIVDFGIAKFASHEEGEIQALTKTGEIFGSPLYMSPEQCLGSRVDHRSDIYSLGCVFFECLTGLPPFVGENALSTMMKHQSENHGTLSEASLGFAFPIFLEEIISQMLAKKPDERYQSLEAVADDLKKVLSTSANRKRSSPLEILMPENSQLLMMTKTKLVLICLIVALLSMSFATFALLLFQKLKSPEEKFATSSKSAVASAVDVHTSTKITDFDELEPQALTNKDIDLKAAHLDDGWLHFGSRLISRRVLEHISHVPDLKKVGLTECRIESDGLPMLATMRSLSELNLSGSNIDDKGAKYLSACKHLISLHISGTNITDSGLIALTNIKGLQRLAAGNLKISDDGIKKLVPPLTYLDLRGDLQLTSRAMATISKLDLDSMEVDHTGIDDAGLSALAPNQSLLQIGLSSTAVTAQGVRLFLTTHKKVRRINLSLGPKLSQSEVDNLKREFPGVIFDVEKKLNLS